MDRQLEGDGRQMDRQLEGDGRQTQREIDSRYIDKEGTVMVQQRKMDRWTETGRQTTEI